MIKMNKVINIAAIGANGGGAAASVNGCVM